MKPHLIGLNQYFTLDDTSKIEEIYKMQVTRQKAIVKKYEQSLKDHLSKDEEGDIGGSPENKKLDSSSK